MIKLNTNDAIFSQTQVVNPDCGSLTKQLSKLRKQLKETHEVPQQSHMASCELYNGNHPTEFPPTNKEVNYVGNTNIKKYQNNNFPQNNNFNQGWIFEAGPSSRQPFQHYSQAYPQQHIIAKLEDALN